jgi:shikimate dehydrogenase
VNTVKLKPGRLEGFNTDAQGFLNDLSEKGFSPQGKAAAVLGAGGASRAVCYALAKGGCRKITVYNRDSHKGGRLVEHLKAQFPRTETAQSDSPGSLGIEEAQLLVNATSVGMKADEPLLVDPGLLRPGLFVYDLIYAPPETKLLKAAREKGCAAANGLGMLLHQAMLSFEIWTGHRAPRNAMQEALEKAAAG